MCWKERKFRTCTFSQHLFHQAKHITTAFPLLVSLSNLLIAYIHFPYLSARDPGLKSRREVCGQRGACLHHAEIQRGP